MSEQSQMPMPFDTNQSVQVQAGSVVSKTLINKSSGTVTLFAFDAGQSLSEHTAPYDALVVLLDGTAEISVAGVAHQVLAGQSMMLPANKPHALKAVTAYKMMLIMIKSNE